MADSLAEAEIKLGALKGDLAERGLALAEAQAAARERTEANNHLMVELLGADKRLSESVVALAGMGQQIIDLRFKEERLSTELANRSGEIAIAQQAQLNALSIQERLNNQLNLTKSSNAELRKELSALNEELSMRQSELVAARQLARNAIDALAIVATPIAAATPNKWRRMLGSKE